MLRPGRLVLVLVAAFAVYMGFFATPGGDRDEAAFDPAVVATNEAAMWQAAKTHQDFSVYFDLVLLLREQDRYTWFRAAEAGFYLASATTTFTDLHAHYERVLPDLEEAAAIEKDWTSASFDPADVARAELDWWVARRQPNQSSADNVASLMADEYALRYHMASDRVSAATTLRAQARERFDDGGVDPDWTTITKELTDSYRELRAALQERRTARDPTL